MVGGGAGFMVQGQPPPLGLKAVPSCQWGHAGLDGTPQARFPLWPSLAAQTSLLQVTGCSEEGARRCWWHGGESWLGEGEQVSAHAANLVFGECDMTNLSEIQTGESAFCRNIQAYPLPQVSNTSGLFHSPVRRPFYLTRGRVIACNSGIQCLIIVVCPCVFTFK